MSRDLNELTKKLLAEGYDENHYPDYVKIGGGCFGGKKLDNFYGGFEYTADYLKDKVFETPCGLLMKYNNGMGHMGYKGIEWTVENDLATTPCPYRMKKCDKRHELLNDQKWTCNIHMTDREWKYEGSVENIRDNEQNRIRKEHEEYIAKHKGYCDRQMNYDLDEGKWTLHWSPVRCGECRYCTLFNRENSKKKGNVFYDLKTTYTDHSKDGTFWEGETITHIEKGKRFFEKNKSMSICELVVKCAKKEVIEREIMRHHTELYFHQYHGEVFEMEVMNIRAAQREGRDLLQDLQDIQNGTFVSWETDNDKDRKEKKRLQRETAKEERTRKIEKKILKDGFDNMDVADQMRARKLLGNVRISELEVQRRKEKEAKAKEPVQLSFDFT